MKGLTTQNEIEILQELGLDLSNVIIRRDEASCKWFLEIHVSLPHQEEQIIISKGCVAEGEFLHIWKMLLGKLGRGLKI
jgi:hypothetical protein